MTKIARWVWAFRLAWGALALAGCGDDTALDRTLATLEVVRGQAQLADQAAPRIARAAAGPEIVVSERGLARLALDGGPQLLLDQGTHLVVVDENTLTMSAGRVYAETDPAIPLEIRTSQGTLRIVDAAISLVMPGHTDEGQMGGFALEAYVVRGELSWRTEHGRGIASAGERLRLGGTARTEAVALWQDWTGGLAQPGPADATGPAGVGMLEARVPDEVGQARWPLVIRRLDVQVRVLGDASITEVEQVFFNPASEAVEGLYRIRVPEGAVLQRFAVDRQGRLVDGYVREQQQARAAYEAQVYRGSTLDPALLEWVAPERYQARIYPIGAGESRRIVVRYVEWLHPVAEGQPRLYRYPMGGGRSTPRIQELSITADLSTSGTTHVRAGMGAAIEEGYVRLRRSDFAPRSDFWMELDGAEPGQSAWRARHEPPPRAPDAREVPGEADETDYWYLPLRLPERLAQSARAQGVDLVVVADVSAATDRAHLELGRSVVEALTAHLSPQDRLTVVTGDLAIHSLSGADAHPGEASAARVNAMLDALARVPAGGATDLGSTLAQAAALLDPARPGALVYVGDGAPTVGEIEADGLREALARLPARPRLYAIGIGSDANLDLLDVLTRGGGLALRVEERSAAADAALAVFAHASRPIAQRVRLDLGTGLDHVYPREEVDVVIGDVLPVAARIRDQPPSSITVHGVVAGQPFDTTIAIVTRATEQSADLRLRWAGERLRQLLLEGASREEVAELGTRYGLITPFTSFYVPSAQELLSMGPGATRWIDRPDLLAERQRTRAPASALLTLALGPFALAGCAGHADESAPAPEARASEGEMGTSAPANGAPAATSNRYGIEGPSEQSPPPPPQMPQQAQGQPPQPTTAAGPVFMNPPGAAVDEAAAPMAERQRQVQLQQAGAASARDVLAADPSAPAEPIAGGTQMGLRLPQTQTGSSNHEGGYGAPHEAPRHPVAATRPAPARRAHREDIGGFDLDGGGGGGGTGEGSHGRFDDNELVITTTTTTFSITSHARERCSDAADLSLDDRRALWRERLDAGYGAYSWIEVYRAAVRDCEAQSWRDRRALLDLILGKAGGVAQMIAVYQGFDSAAARGYLRAAILRRVRSPEDLRAVRNAFGLGSGPDWTLVEQILERAPNEEARLRALRQLVAQYPDDFDLQLRLLEALEAANRGPEARRLAEHLRADPRADPGVRTAVGEMYLRMNMEEDARRVFSEIVEFAPLDELARRRLGDLYRAHAWFEDAYRQYETLARIRPDDPSVLLLLAQAAAGAGRVDEALRLEQRLMETSEPGAQSGIGRVAMLWSSVRLAKLRAHARESHDEAMLQALAQRMRRSGVLRDAGDVRVTLTWAHPDAQLSLWAGYPGRSPARPADLAPENGLEAFDIAEQEGGDYRIEVRRADPTSPQALDAEVIVVWHEGREDEVVRVVPLHFAAGRASYRWALHGSELRDAG